MDRAWGLLPRPIRPAYARDWSPRLPVPGKMARSKMRPERPAMDGEVPTDRDVGRLSGAAPDTVRRVRAERQERMRRDGGHTAVGCRRRSAVPTHRFFILRPGTFRRCRRTGEWVFADWWGPVRGINSPSPREVTTVRGVQNNTKTDLLLKHHFFRLRERSLAIDPPRTPQYYDRACGAERPDKVWAMTAFLGRDLRAGAPSSRGRCRADLRRPLAGRSR